MSSCLSITSSRELAQHALHANKNHQAALKAYTERLEAEVEMVDKLLNALEDEDEDEEPELDIKGSILMPGATKAIGIITPADFLDEESPFYEEASRRSRYMSYIETHPMKARELDVLAEAVKTENCRRYALNAQRRGQFSFFNTKDLPENYFELNKEGIDWDNVAEKVSVVSSFPRTARECEIRWLGGQHPDFNHDQWDQGEIQRLQDIVANVPDGEVVDWADAAKKLGTKRTPIDCMRHALVKPKTLVWDKESDNRLLEAVDIYGVENWNMVARHVSEDATPVQCQHRYVRTLDPTLKRGNWSPEEDARLRLAVAAHGNSWIDVALFIPGRNSEQCRDRWTDKLSPTLTKGKWSQEDDKALLAAVSAIGSSSWKEISDRLSNGRTDNMCRARYDALMKKQALLDAGPSMSVLNLRPTKVKDPRVRKSKTVTPASAGTTPGPSTTTTPGPDGEETSVRPKPKAKPRPRKITTPAESLDTDLPGGSTNTGTTPQAVLTSADNIGSDNETPGLSKVKGKRKRTDVDDNTQTVKRRIIPRRKKVTDARSSPGTEAQDSGASAQAEATTQQIPDDEALHHSDTPQPQPPDANTHENNAPEPSTSADPAPTADMTAAKKAKAGLGSNSAKGKRKRTVLDDHAPTITTRRSPRKRGTTDAQPITAADVIDAEAIDEANASVDLIQDISADRTDTPRDTPHHPAPDADIQEDDAQGPSTTSVDPAQAKTAAGVKKRKKQKDSAEPKKIQPARAVKK